MTVRRAIARTPIRSVSFGGGVQSTALLVLAAQTPHRQFGLAEWNRRNVTPGC